MITQINLFYGFILSLCVLVIVGFIAVVINDYRKYRKDKQNKKAKE